MTPAQHATAALAAITTATAPRTQFGLGPTDADWLVAQAHATLSKALGTGTRYTDAEAALAVAEGPDGLRTYLTRANAAQAALAHAILADR